MAAMLAEIKSRMLLRDRARAGGERTRAPNWCVGCRVRACRGAAISTPAAHGAGWYAVVVDFERAAAQPLPEVTLDAVLDAFRDVLRRADMFADHRVQREALSLRERMSVVLARASSETFTPFHAFFSLAEGRAGVVVTLIAILELLKEALIEIVQNAEHDPIYVKLVA